MSMSSRRQQQYTPRSRCSFPVLPPASLHRAGVLSPGTALTRAARQPRIFSCRYLEEVESES